MHSQPGGHRAEGHRAKTQRLGAEVVLTDGLQHAAEGRFRDAQEQPHPCVFIDKLPKKADGKVLKTELQAKDLRRAAVALVCTGWGQGARLPGFPEHTRWQIDPDLSAPRPPWPA